MTPPIKVTFTLRLKDHPQVAILLWTLEQAGAELDKVKVQTERGAITGAEALSRWREHLSR